MSWREVNPVERRKPTTISRCISLTAHAAWLPVTLRYLDTFRPHNCMKCHSITSNIQPSGIYFVEMYCLDTIFWLNISQKSQKIIILFGVTVLSWCQKMEEMLVKTRLKYEMCLVWGTITTTPSFSSGNRMELFVHFTSTLSQFLEANAKWSHLYGFKRIRVCVPAPTISMQGVTFDSKWPPCLQAPTVTLKHTLSCSLDL